MGKLINLKKSLLLGLLFCSLSFSVFCQSAGTDKSDDLTRSEIESSIVLSDNPNPEADKPIEASKSGSGLGIFIRMLVVLIIVVALIYFVFYFIKKKTNVVKNDDDYLRRAAYINIAPGKTVEVITLIDKAYLIGVTEDNITLLGEINDDELIKAMNITADKKNNTKKPSTFSEVLDMFLVKGNKQKNVFSETESKVEKLGTTENTQEENKE